VIDRTIEDCIWNNAQLLGEKIAVKSGRYSVTYAELRVRIIAAATFYRGLPHYERGKSVIISAGKQLEFLYAYFGAHLAGLRAAPVSEDINLDRFAYIKNKLAPLAVVGFDRIETDVHKVPLVKFADLDCNSDSYVLMPKPQDIADILFTTGTTGAPKGVPLTFANEYAAAKQINTYIKNRQEDIELLALPVSHSFGLGRLRCCLMNGQTIILLGSFANVKKIFRTIEEENVSGFTMVPASWKYLQKMVGDKLSQFAGQLKYIEMGSAFFSEDDKRHLAALFPNTRVTMHYGLTEASRSAFMEFHEDTANLSSVGKSSPNVDIGIFDADGIRQPPGQEGEICVKGKHVMRGYLWQDNNSIFWGDYFRTGDCGVMTVDGYIYLKSRIKELINVGGKKVAPAEVDEQILKIPGVVDCACVGVSDPDGVLGEVVKGCIVKDSANNITFDEIATALVGKLETYKIPVVWQWIESVPKTHNGKVQRSLLK
jgi:long-chain acyl-CoA synthetase